MKAYLLFALAALHARNAYIDFDGTLAHSVHVPAPTGADLGGDAWLQAWQLEINRMGRGRLVYTRLLFLLVLRLLGVRLHLWTNRGPAVRDATLLTLGLWVRLFMTLGFYGQESNAMPDKTASAAEHLGPLMDDMPKYVALGKPGSMLVRKY